LVNAYRPSEYTVVTTVNPRIYRLSGPANLGTGIGRYFIVDRASYNRLTLIGVVGKLLIKGPTLSSGCFNNAAKTGDVFI
ncbi:hypothetical protein QBC39DRAFT_264346, partial [Podospora conica]